VLALGLSNLVEYAFGWVNIVVVGVIYTDKEGISGVGCYWLEFEAMG